MQTQAINPITGSQYRSGYNPGAQNGSSFYRWDGNLLIVEPRSHTSREERYRIECNTRTGHITCTCDAYKFADKSHGQVICKHIRAEADWIADELAERLITIKVKQVVSCPPVAAYQISEDPF